MVPLLKDGDNYVANNPPISLLPVLFNGAERTALRQNNFYLTRKNIVSQHHSGNQKFRSTETMSLLVTNHIFKAADEKKLTTMLLLDLSKAFNCIYRST